MTDRDRGMRTQLDVVLDTRMDYPDPMPQAAEPDKVRRVRELLATLTPVQQEVVQLRSNGLKHREIGEMIWPELSEGRSTTRSGHAWRAARAKLRGEHHRGWRPRKTREERLAGIEERDPFITIIRAALQLQENN